MIRKYLYKAVSVILTLALMLPAFSAGYTVSALSSDVNAVYVSPTGDDSASGTASSPVAGIDAAIRRAKETGASTVYFYSGTYFFPSTLQLGTDESNISFIAADGAEVSFSGGLNIGGCWDGTDELNCGTTYWYKTLSQEQMDDIGQVTSFYNENGVLSNARMPDNGYFYAEGGGRAQGTNPTFLQNLSIYGKTNDVGKLYYEEDIGNSFIRIYHYWVEEIAHVVSYNRLTGEMLLSNISGNTVNAGDAYCIENVLAGFNSPGEWYMDYTGNRLCYIPVEGDDYNSTPFYIGYTEKLIEIDGGENISFEGILFENTGWNYEVRSTQAAYGEHSAVTVFNSTGVDFINCRFEKTGGAALCFGNYGSGVSDCTVSGCSFNRIGAQAVVISGTGSVSNTAAYAENITVTDNLIANYGEKRKMATGILAPYCRNCTITHNEIHDAMYSGISCGWSWGYNETTTDHNDISYNLIYNIGNGPLSDMGGIYTLGLQSGTKINNNVIFNVRTGEDATTYGGWGIYLDEGSSDIEVKNNVVYGCGSQGLHQHYGQNNIISNNIFAYNEEGQVRSSRNEVTSGRNNQFTLSHNILAGNDQLMFHHIDYGQFTDVNNLFFDKNCPAGTVYSGENPDADCGSNHPVSYMTANGYYNNAVFADPCFIDAENGNFGFSSTESAEAAGFNASDIDCSSVGSSSFGSRYLLNDLPGAKLYYPASQWNSWMSAKASAVDSRSSETVAVLAGAYNALKSRGLNDGCYVDATYYFNEADPVCSAYFSAENTVYGQAQNGSVSPEAENALISAFNAMQNTTYTIALNYNGGNSMSGNISYSFESVVALPEPVRTGYRFDGYLRSSDGETVTNLERYLAGAGNYTLTAVWTKSHTLMLDDYNLFDFDSYSFGSYSAGVADAVKDAGERSITITTSGEDNIFVNVVPADRFNLNPDHRYRIHFNCVVKDSAGIVQNNSYPYTRVTLLTYYNSDGAGHRAGDWAGEYHNSTYESLKNGGIFTVHGDASTVAVRFGAGNGYAGTAQSPYTIKYSDIYLEDISDGVGSYIQTADGESVGMLPEYGAESGFIRWNTAKDGTGEFIDKNTEMTPFFADVITLFSQTAKTVKVYFDNEFDFSSVGYATSAEGNSFSSYTVNETEKTYSVTSSGNDCYVNTGSDVHMRLTGGHTYAVYYDVEVTDPSGAPFTNNPYNCSRITILPYATETGGELMWRNNPMCTDIVANGGEFTVNSTTPFAQLRFGLKNGLSGYTVKYSNVSVIDVTDRNASSVPNPWYVAFPAGSELSNLPEVSEVGKTLTGWNTEKDGSGDYLRPGDFLPQNDLYLFSVWEESHTVSFDNIFNFSSFTWHTTGHSVENAVVDYAAENVKFETSGSDAYLNPTSKFRLTAGHTYRFWYQLELDGVKSTQNSRFTLMAYDSDGAWNGTYYRENISPGGTYTVEPGHETFAVRLGMGGSSSGHTLKYSDIFIQDVTCSSGNGAAQSYPVLNGEKLFKKTVRTGYAVGALPVESREGFTFIGWNTEVDGSGIMYTGDEIMGNSDVYLYSQWEESTVSVRFNVNHDNVPVNLLTVCPDEITKNGLNCKYDRATGVITLNGTPTAGGTLFSLKIPNLTAGTYTARAEYLGGSVSYIDGRYNSAPYFEWTQNGVGVTNSGRKFIDIRFENNNLSPVSVISKQITVGEQEAINRIYFNYYYADSGRKAFENYQFRVSLTKTDSVYGTSPCAVDISYGAQYGTLPEVTREGCDFLGWYTSARGGTRITETSVCEADEKIVLFARWRPCSHKTVFDLNSGNDAGKPCYSVITKLKDGSFENVSSGISGGIRYSYDALTGIITFNGTLTSSSSTYFYIPFTVEDVSAKYKIRIKRISDDNSLDFSDTLKHITLTADYCTADGSNISTRKFVDTFMVYNKNQLSESGGMLPVLSESLASEVKGIRLWSYVPFDENSTGFAAFVDYKFRIEIIEESTNTSFRENVPPALYTRHNGTLKSLPVPVREGYTFAGWYTDSLLTVPFDAGTPITSDATLYAKWYFYELTGTAYTDSSGELLCGVCVKLSEDSISEYLVWDESVNVICVPSDSSGILGTGSLVRLSDSDTGSIFKEYTVVLFGDVNGDGLYDGQDSVIVSCIASGMLGEEQTGRAVFAAADCNRDGAVDAVDVTLLDEAGALLVNINQSETGTLETDALYRDYLELIDQGPVLLVEPEKEAEPVDTYTFLDVLRRLIEKLIYILTFRAGI